MCRAKSVLCKPYRIGLVLGLAALLSGMDVYSSR